MSELCLVRGRWLLEGFEGDTPVVHENAAAVIEGGRISEIGSFEDMRRTHSDAPVVGGANAAVIPGLINAHHHIGLTPLQLGSEDHPLELWFASRLHLRDVDLYLDTLYSAFEMIETGITTVQHLQSRAAGGLSDLYNAAGEVIRAYRDIGMRASYSMAVRDQNRLVYESDEDFTARLPESLRPTMEAYFTKYQVPLSDQIGLFEALHGKYSDHARIRIQLAPSNLHWLSEDALRVIAETSEKFDAPMHTHLVETQYQKHYAQKRTGGSALAHFHRHGLTGPRLTVGHGVWMTEEDIDILAETHTCVCHNCSSNLRLKSGIAPVNRFLAKGIPVAIGIDEAGINDDRDMLQEMRMVLRMHREPGIDAPFPTPAQVFRMATHDASCTTPFGHTIGRLSPGSRADVAILDWNAVTSPYQDSNIPFLDVLVQRAKAGAVRTVMIEGDVVYDQGKFTHVDRDAVLKEISDQLSRPLTSDEQDRQTLAKAVFPYVQAFYRENYLLEARDPFYRYNDRL